MTVSLQAMQKALNKTNGEIVAWTQKRDKAQQVLTDAEAELAKFEGWKTQLEADIAAYTPA